MGIEHSNPVGRSNTVLVSHAAGEPVAVVTQIVARPLQPKHRCRLVISGPVGFTPETQHHLGNVVLPVVNQVISALGVKPRGFELSVVNLSAASAHDLGTQVEGYSIDTAAALAMLSAALRLPLRQDMVSTGHIASTVGDIRPVRSLSQKLHAACGVNTIHTFVCASLSADRSLESFAPALLQEAVAAVASASTRLRVMQVENIGELVLAATTEEARLRGALATGYFYRQQDDRAGAAAHLVRGLEDSFWRILEVEACQGHFTDARRLLHLRCRADLKRRHYPARIGTRLMAMLHSMPPVMRRRRGFFPLLEHKTCFALGLLASPKDQSDAGLLLYAATGQGLVGALATPKRQDARSSSASATASLEAMLEAISVDTLTKDIGIPADNARAGFTLPGVLIEEYDQFIGTLSAFYLTLARHVELVDLSPAPDDALGLVERAFAKMGGFAGARAEARYGVNGGMRYILDLMTEQYKREQRFKRVSRVMKEWMDPLDWQQQVNLMQAFLDRQRDSLPDEMKRIDASRLVDQHEELVHAYVQGLDQVENIIRRL